MRDVILDTNIVGDFLAQYFDGSAASRGNGHFLARGRISKTLAHELNRILDYFSFSNVIEQNESAGLVIVSAFAIIELTRKWDAIVLGRFSIMQFEAFLLQPPDWFDLAPVDQTLLPYFVDIPTHVFIGGQAKAIEWCDAVHVATAASRGTESLLATSDQRLQAIGVFQGRILG